MLNSPVDCKSVMKHPEIERLAKERILEIVKYPAYFTDEQVMNKIRTNTNTSVIYYIAYCNGIIPIATIGGYKAFIVDFKKSPSRTNLYQLRSQSRGGNNIKPLRKRHQRQRGSA